MQQSTLGRWFWRRWFARDGMLLDAAHSDHPTTRLPRHRPSERRAALPWLPPVRALEYLFLGRRD